jgi:CubicO group peptidase (beta-lactamase class C family)
MTEQTESSVRASAQGQGNRLVEGTVEVGFETVRDAFAANFLEREELGAAFAATIDGTLVVDLWGGIADANTQRPWGRDTLQVIFSGTKALVALCLLMLVDRGTLDLEAPVCRYWPEFASHAKQSIRVIDLASHHARLPGFRTAVTEDDLTDDIRMAELLADQPVDADPRAADTYHALTYGWLCGEVIRRIDGRSVGRFFADEVAKPLALDIWIGLPAELENRVTSLRYAPSWVAPPWWDAEQLAADTLLARVWNNPPILPADHLPWNRADWHRAEIPGAGGIASARSMARLYGCLARGGELEGIRLLSNPTLELGRTVVRRRLEPLLAEPQALGVGFQLQTERRVFGQPEDAFGHTGAGGSVHCAWPADRVGVSYTMNSLRNDDIDPRAHELLAALYAALHTRPDSAARSVALLTSRGSGRDEPPTRSEKTELE